MMKQTRPIKTDTASDPMAEVQEMTRAARDFARRNPAVVLGGAALLGFAAARRLKATEGRDQA